MPRPRKYPGLYDRQAAYHQTEKGKAAKEKYEHSQAGKERKRRWLIKQRGYADKRELFIQKYGEPEQVLSQLNSREKQIIILYFGLSDTEPQTEQAIGESLNLSRSRIGEIKRTALKKLQTDSEPTNSLEPQQI